MSMEDKIKAAAKDAEGKLQSAAGELANDDQMKLEGEAKQVQASAMNTVADLKDKAAEVTDNVKNALMDAVNSVQEKLK